MWTTYSWPSLDFYIPVNSLSHQGGYDMEAHLSVSDLVVDNSTGQHLRIAIKQLGKELS